MSMEYNPGYLHHKNQGSSATLRELVFGMEDGMVSTLGAITGIAAAAQNHQTVILAGLVIISVESISMAVGSYLSSKSARDMDERKIEEEKIELEKFPEEEKEELIEMYVVDGWPKELAKTMVDTASKNKSLFLKEMSYRELGVVEGKLENPFKNGLVMGISYILGGTVPLMAYFLLPISSAIFVSVAITLFGLFLLGVYTASLSKRTWWKAGLEMFALASVAALVGYFVGQLVQRFFI